MWKDIRFRVWALFRRGVAEEGLDDEFRFHLDRETQRNVERGFSTEESRRLAGSAFGQLDALKDDCRQAWGIRQLDLLRQDVRQGVRGLGRRPGFTTAVVATLALGIGAMTAIVSVVDAVLLRPVPFEAMERLVLVWETDRDSGTTREPSSYPDFRDFQAGSTQLSDIGAFMGVQLNAGGERAFRLTGVRATHGFLPMLGVSPAIGRFFRPDEDAVGGAAVAVISERLGASLFGSSADAVGRTLLLDEVAHTIVGVAARGSDLGILQILSAADYSRSFADRGTRVDVDVWIPLQANAETLPRATHPIFVMGRLAPGATVDSAHDELGRIARELEAAYPENDARGVFVEPLSSVVFGPTRSALLILFAAAGLMLAVACANVANLLLTRASTRMREVAVRRALGADRRRLTRQFLVEGGLLTALSMVVALVLATVGLEGLVAMASHEIPRLDDVALNANVLLTAFGLSICVGSLFGLAPLAQSGRSEPQRALKGGQPAAVGQRGLGGARRVFVVMQVALAVILLVGAGLLTRSFWHLVNVDTGFQARDVTKVEYQLPTGRYPVDMSRFPDFAAARTLNTELLERTAALPGVASAALAGNHPLDPGFTNSFVVVGRETEASDWPEISVRRVTAEYFSTVRVALVTGREIQPVDDTRSPLVAVINEAAADRFFPDRHPIGQQVRFWGVSRRVVGVVENELFRGVERGAPLAIYLPLEQSPSLNRLYTLVVRSQLPTSTVAADVRQIAQALDPTLALFGVEALGDTVSRSTSQRRFILLLLVLFAGVAVMLASVGVHGLLSYDMARRTREIGIRMALGAGRSGITRLVLRDGAWLIGIGLAVGAVGAVSLSRFVSSLMFGITEADAVTFGGVFVIVAVLGFVACLAPARRAARTDPLMALRSE